jgi:hypothetical protein
MNLAIQGNLVVHVWPPLIVGRQTGHNSWKAHEKCLARTNVTGTKFSRIAQVRAVTLLNDAGLIRLESRRFTDDLEVPEILATRALADDLDGLLSRFRLNCEVSDHPIGSSRASIGFDDEYVHGYFFSVSTG